MSEPVYDTFKDFCQTNEYNVIEWLVLMSLDKGKERKAWDSYSQLNHQVHALKVSLPALKETHSVTPGQRLLKTKPRIS